MQIWEQDKVPLTYFSRFSRLFVGQRLGSALSQILNLARLEKELEHGKILIDGAL